MIDDFGRSAVPIAEQILSSKLGLKELTNHNASDNWGIVGSVGRRGRGICLLPQALSDLFEPSPWVRAVNNASQKTQALPDIVPIATDILFGNFCI